MVKTTVQDLPDYQELSVQIRFLCDSVEETGEKSVMCRLYGSCWEEVLTGGAAGV